MDIKAEILPLIKPVGTDDNGKYNRKFYNLLKGFVKPINYGFQMKIWFNTKSRWDGNNIEFHENIYKEQNIQRQIMIDPSGQMIAGYFLTEALQKNKPTRFSLCTFHPDNMIDITDWFINTYVKLGRCMLDPQHHDFDNHYNNRYHIINKNHRKCRWCEEHFHREIEKVVKIKKYVFWKESNPNKFVYKHDTDKWADAFKNVLIESK